MKRLTKPTPFKVVMLALLTLFATTPKAVFVKSPVLLPAVW